MGDKNYIREIAENLNGNRVSLLVGAGFSKNAKNKNGGKNQMKDWGELIQDLKDELPSNTIRELENANFSNSEKYLALADTFEINKKREVLLEKLELSVADGNHHPGELHYKLFDFSWENIITTNYDTLLERADKRNLYYKVVKNEDLHNTEKKHFLIKMHGSIDDRDSCVITKSDYSNYDEKHEVISAELKSIFTKQKVLLIGFSGEDPNYHSILNWLEKNLENFDFSNIYMINNIKETKEKNVKDEPRTINLNTLFPSGTYEEKLYAFFDELKEEIDNINTRLYSKYKWINKEDVLRATSLDNKDLEGNIRFLEDLNNRYPGWISLPRKYIYISRLINRQIEGRLEKLLAVDDLDSLEFLEKYLEFIDKIDGYILEKDLLLIKNYLDKEIYKDNELFMRINIYLLRHFRQIGDYKEFKERDKLVSGYKNSHHCNYCHNEYILYLLATGKIEEFKCKVENWEVGEDYYYRYKKISFQTYYKDIEFCYEKAFNLKEDLRMVKDEEMSASIQSIENCLIFLLNTMKGSNRNHKKIKEESDLYKKLDKEIIGEAYSWKEENSYYLNLFNHKFKVEESETKSSGFELGRTRYKLKITNKNIDSIRNAYEYINFREKTGIPYSLANVTIQENIQECFNRILITNNKFPLSFCFLTNNKKFDELDMRKILYGRLESEVDIEIKRYIDLIEDYLLGSLNEKNYFSPKCIDDYIANTILFMLSYLIYKSSLSTRDRLLEMCKNIYESDKTINMKGMEQLLIRLIGLYTDKEKVERLSILLDFKPVIQDEWSRAVNPYLDPIKYLSYSSDKVKLGDEVYGEIKEKLLKGPYSREEKLYRYLVLYDYLIIDEEDNKIARKHLWNRQKEGHSLPDIGSFFNMTYIKKELYIGYMTKAEVVNIIYLDLCKNLKNYSDSIENSRAYGSGGQEKNLLTEVLDFIYEVDLEEDKINILLEYILSPVNREIEKLEKISHMLILDSAISNINIFQIILLTLIKKGVRLNDELKESMEKISNRLYNLGIDTYTLDFLLEKETNEAKLIKTILFDKHNQIGIILQILNINIDFNFTVFTLEETKKYVEMLVITLSQNRYNYNYWTWKEIEKLVIKLNQKVEYEMDNLIISIFKEIKANIIELNNKEEDYIIEEIDYYNQILRIIGDFNFLIIKEECNKKELEKIFTSIKDKIFVDGMYVDILKLKESYN